MEAIISDMLAFARQGKAVEDVPSVTLESVAESAWETVDTEGIELVPEGSLRFEAHESRLCQGLENLFRNAAGGGEEVSTVWIGPLDSRGFYVEDGGVSISPDDRDDVFESENSSTPDETGFGLPIVKAVMEAHGWPIDLSEGREGGARFEIRFGE